MSCPIHVVLALASCGFASAAYAQSSFSWFGGAGLTSDRIERGVSQSDRKASVDAQLGLRDGASGLYAALGVASVSDQQYVGSDGYKLMPEIGWAHSFGADGDGRAGVLLRGHVFPGARGPWFGGLPPRAQTAALQANASDYQTAEAGVSVGWKVLTLSLTRSLTDYFGLSATEVSPGGSRVLDSAGTTYVGLDIDWPLAERFSLALGGGRLTVPNFESLGYTDWRAGMSYQMQSFRFSLQASGSDASSAGYRLRRRNGDETTNAGDTAVTASLAWSF